MDLFPWNGLFFRLARAAYRTVRGPVAPVGARLELSGRPFRHRVPPPFGARVPLCTLCDPGTVPLTLSLPMITCQDVFASGVLGQICALRTIPCGTSLHAIPCGTSPPPGRYTFSPIRLFCSVLFGGHIPARGSREARDRLLGRVVRP